MNIKPIYEFLVWDNCNNNCKFCFQREKPRLFNHSERNNILNETIKFIESDTFKKGSHILICGGEIFDKPSDFNSLHNFFINIIDKMNKEIIDLLYLNTNLIYDDMSGLFDTLNIIQENNLFERLKFTTSYDLEGRYSTPEKELLFKSNLKLLKEKYPDIHIVTNTILTKQVCKAIINGNYDINEWMKEYQCYVNLIPYIVLDKNLMASRDELFSSLNIIEEQSPGYLKKWIDNLDLRQEKWLYMYKDNDWKFVSCDWDDDCGHAVNFKRYSDNGTCFVCDLKELFDGKI